MAEPMTQEEFALECGLICPVCRVSRQSSKIIDAGTDCRLCWCCHSIWEQKSIRQVTGYRLVKRPSNN